MKNLSPLMSKPDFSVETADLSSKFTVKGLIEYQKKTKSSLLTKTTSQSLVLSCVRDQKISVILRSQGLQKHEFQSSFALVPYRKTVSQQGGKVSYIRGVSVKCRHTISPGNWSVQELAFLWRVRLSCRNKHHTLMSPNDIILNTT